MGITRILWLSSGQLTGDDTDGHIDTLARFCNEETIAYVACDDPDDPHYHSLQEMKHELSSLTTQEGTPYKLIPLPMPSPVFNDQGARLPATYANFLIINSAVLVPTYQSPYDEVALKRLHSAFPDRSIIGIDCCAAIEQFGSLHCLTMQLPAGSLHLPTQE
jgi:agmatine/peptidylarginine deiminase